MRCGIRYERTWIVQKELLKIRPRFLAYIIIRFFVETGERKCGFRLHTTIIMFITCCESQCIVNTNVMLPFVQDTAISKLHGVRWLVNLLLELRVVTWPLSSNSVSANGVLRYIFTSNLFTIFKIFIRPAIFWVKNWRDTQNTTQRDIPCGW